MTRHIVIVAVLWVSVTIVGEAAALTLIPFRSMKRSLAFQAIKAAGQLIYQVFFVI